MNKKIEVLDCTLRDGGLALEDAMLVTGSKSSFKENTVLDFIKTMKSSLIDIVELGAIEITNKNQFMRILANYMPFSRYQVGET